RLADLLEQFDILKSVRPDELPLFLTKLRKLEALLKQGARPAARSTDAGTSPRRRRRASIPADEIRRWKQVLGWVNDYRQGFTKFASEDEAWRRGAAERGWTMSPWVVDHMGVSLLRHWAADPDAFAVDSTEARFCLWWLCAIGTLNVLAGFHRNL